MEGALGAVGENTPPGLLIEDRGCEFGGWERGGCELVPKESEGGRCS